MRAKLEKEAPRVLEAWERQGVPFTTANLRRAGLQRLAELQGHRPGGDSISAPPAETDPPDSVRQLQSQVEELQAALHKTQNELQKSTQNEMQKSTVEVVESWESIMYSRLGVTREVPMESVGSLVSAGEITQETHVLVRGMTAWATFSDFIEMHGLQDELLESKRSASREERQAEIKGAMVEGSIGDRSVALLHPYSLSTTAIAERRAHLLRTISPTGAALQFPNSERVRPQQPDLQLQPTASPQEPWGGDMSLQLDPLADTSDASISPMESEGDATPMASPLSVRDRSTSEVSNRLAVSTRDVVAVGGGMALRLLVCYCALNSAYGTLCLHRPISSRRIKGRSWQPRGGQVGGRRWVRSLAAAHPMRSAHRVGFGAAAQHTLSGVLGFAWWAYVVGIIIVCAIGRWFSRQHRRVSWCGASSVQLAARPQTTIPSPNVACQLTQKAEASHPRPPWHHVCHSEKYPAITASDHWKYPYSAWNSMYATLRAYAVNTLLRRGSLGVIAAGTPTGGATVGTPLVPAAGIVSQFPFLAGRLTLKKVSGRIL